MARPGRIALVLVAAEAGRLAASPGVQLPDDAADLSDDELAQEVAVLVVDLLEVVYVSHEDAQGFAHRRRRLQAVLELLVEALLGEQAGEVVAVDQVVQGAMELRLHRIVLRKLQHGVANKDAVAITQLAASRTKEGFAVHHDPLTGTQIPYEVGARARLAMDAGVLRCDLHVPHHDVPPERVAPQDELPPVQRVEIPEPRPLQDHEVRVPGQAALRGDNVLLCARRSIRF